MKLTKKYSDIKMYALIGISNLHSALHTNIASFKKLLTGYLHLTLCH